MSTDKLAERIAATTVGPNDRLVVALPEASPDDLAAVFAAFKDKGFDMSRLLIIGGPDVQLAALSDDTTDTGRPA